MQTVPTPKLLVKRPDGSYAELEWLKPMLTIGRDGSNDLIIDHPLASRRHARLEQIDDGFGIRDLDSTNGTYVNDERISGLYLLHNQDQVVVADTIITFQDPEATVKGMVPPEVLRRLRPEEELRVDSRTKEVFIKGRLLDPPLTVKEFQLLELLYNRKSQVISKDEIAHSVWDYEVFDYNAIDALVYRLRQRIEVSPTAPRYLMTQRGFGYRLITTPE